MYILYSRATLDWSGDHVPSCRGLDHQGPPFMHPLFLGSIKNLTRILNWSEEFKWFPPLLGGPMGHNCWNCFLA